MSSYVSCVFCAYAAPLTSAQDLDLFSAVLSEARQGADVTGGLRQVLAKGGSTAVREVGGGALVGQAVQGADALPGDL